MKQLKRFFLLLFVLLLLVSAFPFSGVYAASVDTSIVRVQLSLNSVTSLSLTVNGNYTLKEKPSFTIKPGTNTISVSNGAIKRTSNGKSTTLSTITLINEDQNGTSSSIRLKNSLYGATTYLGDLYFSLNNSTLRAINYISLEQYLYGVVPYEMSNSFPLEALKTQAVCARSYAYIARTKYASSRAYDILDTSQDQVYHGYVSSYTRAISAVNGTEGKVLSYNGKAIQAYYTASNGGQTERSGNVWSTNLPYYVNQDDPYDLKNTASLQESSFIPKTYNDTTISLMDSIVYDLLEEGAKKLTNSEEVTLVSTESVTAHTPLYAKPSRCFTLVDVSLTVLPKGAAKNTSVTVTIKFSDLIYSSSNKNGIFNRSNTLRMRGAEEGKKTSGGKTYKGFILTNRRYGHGVGMSQRGAQQRASEGQSYLEILSFYYPNTSLISLATKEKEQSSALSSSVYTISSSGIFGVAELTSSKKLLKNLTAKATDTLTLTDQSGAQKTGTVGTGDIVRITSENLSFTETPIIIYGDLNGDGEVGLEDLLKLQKHLLGTSKLNGAYLLAADTSKDSEVDILDLLKLQKHLLGTATITQS